MAEAFAAKGARPRCHGDCYGWRNTWVYCPPCQYASRPNGQSNKPRVGWNHWTYRCIVRFGLERQRSLATQPMNAALNANGTNLRNAIVSRISLVRGRIWHAVLAVGRTEELEELKGTQTFNLRAIQQSPIKLRLPLIERLKIGKRRALPVQELFDKCGKLVLLNGPHSPSRNCSSRIAVQRFSSSVRTSGGSSGKSRRSVSSDSMNCDLTASR